MESKCLEHTAKAPETPRIYVASLADYNAGYLHGRWIDADQSADEMRNEIAELLAESKQPIAEEWAIHDYDNFGSLRLSEFEDLERVAEVARLIVEHGPLFAELVNHLGDASNVEEARRYMEEAYRGAFDSLADYAADLIEDCYADILKSLPDFIRYHIDYDGIGRDLELGDDVFTVCCDGKVHVFDAQI
ncbi:Antirestriction protein (ArdA) [Phycisphaerae bacterium RAS1]|nr:Antirestriction protein (ArdA) [Phycisphaerae bacterium RAS1]